MNVKLLFLECMQLPINRGSELMFLAVCWSQAVLLDRSEEVGVGKSMKDRRSLCVDLVSMSPNGQSSGSKGEKKARLQSEGGVKGRSPPNVMTVPSCTWPPLPPPLLFQGLRAKTAREDAEDCFVLRNGKVGE